MNPADQRFTDRLYKRIADLEKQMQDIKTFQRMGLDNFVYKPTDIVSGSAYIETGKDHILRINYLIEDPKYFASELTMSFFMNNDLDPNYHFPDGSALTDASTLRVFDFFPWYDLYESDELGAGIKTYYLRMANYGTNKTVHFHVGLVFPTGNVT